MVIAVYNLRLVVYHLSKTRAIDERVFFNLTTNTYLLIWVTKVGELSGVSGVVSFCLFSCCLCDGVIPSKGRLMKRDSHTANGFQPRQFLSLQKTVGK